jgi:hypothetical protein
MPLLLRLELMLEISILLMVMRMSLLASSRSRFYCVRVDPSFPPNYTHDIMTVTSQLHTDKTS